MNRNKLFILIAGAIVLIVVVVLLVVFLFSGNTTTTPVDDVLFGDTSEERPFDFDTDPYNPSGTSSAPVLHGDALPALRLLTTEPVAAVTTGTRETTEGRLPFARYIERGTGHVFDADLTSTTPPERMTAVTVPRIQEAYWAATGSTTAFRYLDAEAREVLTYLGNLDLHNREGTVEDGAAPAVLSGAFLPRNIISLAFSPNGQSLFFIVPTESGSLGYVQNLSTGARSLVWDSPIRELQTTWSDPGQILVASRPGSDSRGFAWSVSPVNGRTQLVLSDVPGLTVLANTTGEKILYSALEQTLASLRVLDLANNKVTYLSLISLPEKCVWSTNVPDHLYCAIPFAIPKKNEFPEDWYQGKIHWRDNIWRIDVGSGATKLVGPIEDLVERSIDAVDLTLSPDEQYLVFRSRQDDLLWSLKLPEVSTSTVPSDVNVF